jgi:hypothetical protein
MNTTATDTTAPVAYLAGADPLFTIAYHSSTDGFTAPHFVNFRAADAAAARAYFELISGPAARFIGVRAA